MQNKIKMFPVNEMRPLTSVIETVDGTISYTEFCVRECMRINLDKSRYAVIKFDTNRFNVCVIANVICDMEEENGLQTDI